MRYNLTKLIFFCLLLSLMVPTTSSAQTLTPEQLMSIPPNPDGVTQVYVDLIIMEIPDISEPDETFEVDALLIAQWNDPRLAYDAELFGYGEKLYQDEAVLEHIKTDVWWPGFEIVDSRGPRDKINIGLAIYPDGNVYYTERFNARITQYLDFKEFPFDSHTISITVAPFFYEADQVELISFESNIEDTWETNEWEISYLPPEFWIDTDDDDGTTESDFAGYSYATFALEIERVTTFYITGVIIPLLLIVMISGAVFWMNFNEMHLADRLSVSFTSVLTVVAFDFVSAGDLPKLSYTTYLDNILIASYMFLAVVVLQNVYVASIHENKPEKALRVDRIWRWIFVPVYFGIILILELL